MSESNGSSNGVIQIGDEGLVPFKFGSAADSPVIRVDVLRANDEWADTDWTFREPDGRVKEGKGQEQRTASVEFVRNVIREWADRKAELADLAQKSGDATGAIGHDREAQNAQDVANRLNYAQAARFHAQVALECKKLKPFFSISTGEEPSPPPRSAVTFSE